MPTKRKKTRQKLPREQWVQQYSTRRPLYEEFRLKLDQLIRDLLHNEDINFHVIESRAKTVDSFREKLSRPGKSYSNPLKELTDLTGLRIILYYNDDIAVVSNLLQTEFQADLNRSIDKSQELAPDQFGYTSVHLVLNLSASRAVLSEWKRFAELTVEVQVRTVLQHAWASISHALQYKREEDIPIRFRRKLMRLSGLLELGDEQFSELRKEQVEFTDKIANELADKNLGVPIDAISLSEYLSNSIYALAIGDEALTAGFADSRDNPEYDKEMFQLIPICEVLGISTIEELDVNLKSARRRAKKFFSMFSPLHPGAAGDSDHWSVVLLIALNSDSLPYKLLHATFPSWGDDYKKDIITVAKRMKAG